MDVLVGDLDRVVGLVRLPAGEHLVDDHARGVHVGAVPAHGRGRRDPCVEPCLVEERGEERGEPGGVLALGVVTGPRQKDQTGARDGVDDGSLQERPGQEGIVGGDDGDGGPDGGHVDGEPAGPAQEATGVLVAWGQPLASQAITSEIQKLAPSAVIELFVLDLSLFNEGVVRFHAGTNELRRQVVWQGNTYEPFPIQIGRASCRERVSSPV